MIPILPDAGRADKNRRLRRKIATAQGLERHLLLKNAGEDIRELTPLVVKASATGWDLTASLDMAPVLGAVAAWLCVEPLNPDWPHRDRLFLTRNGDLITAASTLAIMGFFSPHQAARLVDQALADASQSIPGIEAPALPPEAVPALARASALESGRSKRRWRERFMDTDALSWINPYWREAPSVWRTCAIVDHADAAAQAFRSFPNHGGETLAGLVVLVVTSKVDALRAGEQWRAEGWEAVVIGIDDSLELYESLTAPYLGRPLAVILGTGRGIGSHRLRSSETRLLGELSDDQFTALMGETLGWGDWK